MSTKFSGSILKDYRMDACLTQDELAVLIGVTRGIISSWENGRHTPSLRHIKALKRVLKANTFEAPVEPPVMRSYHDEQ